MIENKNFCRKLTFFAQNRLKYVKTVSNPDARQMIHLFINHVSVALLQI